MLKVSKRFVDETLWPNFNAINSELHAHLHDVTARVIREVLDASTSEADEVAATPVRGRGKAEARREAAVVVQLLRFAACQSVATAVVPTSMSEPVVSSDPQTAHLAVKPLGVSR